MTTAIATQAQTNWDFLDEGSTQRSEFLKFKQGQYFCKGLTGDKEVDLTGSLFVAAMPTYRQTLTAWTDDSVAPVEQHEAHPRWASGYRRSGRTTRSAATACQPGRTASPLTAC